MRVLNQWSVIATGDMFTAPELRTKVLRGVVGDKKITTSPIERSSGRTVTTQSGSVYELGSIDPYYKAWLDQSGIKYNEDNPVVVHSDDPEVDIDALIESSREFVSKLERNVARNRALAKEVDAEYGPREGTEE